MKQRNTNKLIVFGIPTLIIILGALFVVSLRIINRLSMSEQLRQREQLKLITSDLELDMSRDQVIEIVNKHEWPLPGIHENEDEIMLSTSPQILATDWKVRLFFNDNLLTAIKYCNADNIEKRPEGAPEDITK